MVPFVLKRLIFAILALWVVATLTFILMHSLVGDAVASNRTVPARIVENLKAKYGLDKPLIKQYTTYMGNLAKGDLGVSMRYQNRSVNSIIARTFPVSADLGVRAFVIALAVGILLGIMGALYKNRIPDHISSTIAIIGVSVPGFILGTLIQYFLCFKLSMALQHLTGTRDQFLPITGWGSFAHTIAPSLALSLGCMGVIMRMMRTSVIEVLDQNYIIAARAKGIPRGTIVLRHVIRNAVLPVVSITGFLITSILIGSFVIESIFSIPGLGGYMVDSVQQKDYTMVIGLSVFTTFLVVTANTISDIFYALLDPRMRLANKSR